MNSVLQPEDSLIIKAGNKKANQRKKLTIIFDGVSFFEKGIPINSGKDGMQKWKFSIIESTKNKALTRYGIHSIQIELPGNKVSSLYKIVFYKPAETDEDKNAELIISEDSFISIFNSSVSTKEDTINLQTDKSDSREKKEVLKTYTNSINMKFILIKAGSFKMGSPFPEKGRKYDETQRNVKISKDFFIQSTEITQNQWKKVMNYDPSASVVGGKNCPVDNISWNDTIEFIKKLNEKENTDKYRLPTEAEWEYAARAKSKKAFANGNITDTGCQDTVLDQIGWYCGNSSNKKHIVAKKLPNRWSLYDMHGNMLEWCFDHYSIFSAPNFNSVFVDPVVIKKSEEKRVLKGGSWTHGAADCRAAARFGLPSSEKGNYISARLVKEP